MARGTALDRLSLAGAALLFSTGGAAVKATSFSGWQAASLRSGIAALVVFLVMRDARRGWSWRVLPVALVYASTMICFVIANKTTTAANAIFLQAAAPAYLLLLAPWLLKEKVHRGDLITLAVIGAGLALVFGDLPAATATAPNPRLGNLMGLLSGITWAFTMLGLRWLGRAEGGDRATLSTVVAGNLIACLICLPFALPLSGGATDWALILYLGAFQIGLAYILLSRGIGGVPALEASLILYIEPALNPVWAWIFHDERPGVLVIAGGVLILTATLARSFLQQPPPARAT